MFYKIKCALTYYKLPVYVHVLKGIPEMFTTSEATAKLTGFHNTRRNDELSILFPGNITTDTLEVKEVITSYVAASLSLLNTNLLSSLTTIIVLNAHVCTVNAHRL